MNKEDIRPFSFYSDREKLGSSDNSYKVRTDGQNLFAKITSIQIDQSDLSKIANKVSLYQRLQHKSIIKFLSIFKDDDKLGYMSPFCKSESLKERLTFLDSTEKMIVLYGFACALKYLKDNKIYPTNLNGLEKIILDDSKYPQLSGFYFSELEETSYNNNDFLIPPEIDNSSSIKESSLPYIFGAYAFMVTTNQNSKESVNQGQELPSYLPQTFKTTIQQCLESESSRPTIDQITTMFTNGSLSFPGFDSGKFNNYKDFLNNDSSNDEEYESSSENDDKNPMSGFSSANPMNNESDKISGLQASTFGMLDSQSSSPQKSANSGSNNPNVITFGSRAATNQTECNNDDQSVSPEYVPYTNNVTNNNEYANPYQTNFAVPVSFGTSQIPDVQTIMSDAHSGNPDAMFVYGKQLYDGQGVPQNLHKAAYYFKQSGKRGNPNGEFFYAMMLENGFGVNKDLAKAIRHYAKSARLGSADGNFKYGTFLDHGIGVNVSRQGAVQHYQRAAMQGHPFAKYLYGFALLKGRGCIKNPELGANLVREAADAGIVSAQNLYGYMLLKGVGTMKDQNRALYYVKMAADQQYPPALNLYAEMLVAGRGIEANPEKAFEFFKKSSELGDPNAENNVGKMYQLGLGVKKDEKEAVQYFIKSAEKGNIQAMVNLGMAYQSGTGVSSDSTKAFKLYSFAAERNNPQAIIFVGICYENGTGVKKDEKMAYQCYERVANMENCNGIYHKGRCLLNGIGIKKNKEEAINVLKYASLKGSTRAQVLIDSL